MTTRDCFGRYAPHMTQEELERYNMFQRRLRELERQKKQEAHLLRYESALLYCLVDYFNVNEYHVYDKTKQKPYKLDDILQYKRKPYHTVLLNHPICHNNMVESKETPGKKLPSPSAYVSFSNLVNRMTRKGWIRKKKHGNHLYLRITEDGLQKIITYYEYRELGVI